MPSRVVPLLLLCLGASLFPANAQDFRILGRDVQVHGFASQAFVHTSDNNWLSMQTTGVGSGQFSDVGMNLSTQVTDRFRIGVQGYDRNLGQLGRWHPSLDWAVADYRLRSWIGFRVGKVKTPLGLYNDTQDLDFLHTFALLPQGVYATDIRDATIAHSGGDLYGTVILKHHSGSISYTGYVGHRSDSIYSGYSYLSSEYLVYYKSYTGLQYGADLHWNTPFNGLLVGVSRMNQDTTSHARWVDPLNAGAGFAPFTEVSKTDGTNQFYAQYSIGKFRIDSEYRRFLHDGIVNGGELQNLTDVRGWYIAGTYRISKRMDVGSYYSHYSTTNIPLSGPLAVFDLPSTDTSLPTNHIYDKVVAARIDLKRFWNIKVEGHFMEGYAFSNFPDGFYPQQNPAGFKPNTNALVLRSSLFF